MKVLLLAGGWSPEREVSLKGGEQIAAALKERGHSVTLCDPAKDFERLMDMAREHDAAFINLHGAPGEDGLVQAILDRVNCPYQGAGPAGSFLALHKAAARQIFRDAGLNIPDGVFLPRHPGPNWKPDLQYPMFVKSNTGGSCRLEPAPFPRHQRRGTLHGPELPVLNGRGSHCGNRRRRP